MNAAKPLLIGIGLYLLAKTASKGYGLTTINSFIAKLPSLSFDGITPIVKITLGLQNPSSASYEIRSFSGNLYANEKLVSNISNFNLQQFRGNSQIYYPITARLTIAGAEAVINELIQVLTGSAALTQVLRVRGTINIDGVPLPIDNSYTIF